MVDLGEIPMVIYMIHRWCWENNLPKIVVVCWKFLFTCAFTSPQTGKCWWLGEMSSRLWLIDANLQMHRPTLPPKGSAI